MDVRRSGTYQDIQLPYFETESDNILHKWNANSLEHSALCWAGKQ